MPLAVTFQDNSDTLCVLMKEPTYMMHFSATKSGDADGTFSALNECKISSAVQNLGKSLNITMPASVLESDQATGKIKLMKNIQEEGRGFVKHEPWMRAERVEKKKEKARRRKKRKIEEFKGATNVDVNEN